jgi:hypothetical protein
MESKLLRRGDISILRRQHPVAKKSFGKKVSRQFERPHPLALKSLKCIAQLHWCHRRREEDRSVSRPRPVVTPMSAHGYRSFVQRHSKAVGMSFG